MFPLTDKDREVLERLGFERSSATANWVKRFADGSVQTIAFRDQRTGHWSFHVRRLPKNGHETITLGSPELIPSLVFAEIEGA